MKTHAMIPAATTADRTALVVTNPRVKSIAFRLRWSAATVVRRTRAALPSPVEQSLYLHVAGAFRLQPESVRKLLDVFLDQPLTTYDLPRRTVGVNLVTSRFDETVDKVEIALRILDKTSDLFELQGLAVRTVAILVQAYGALAEDVILSLVERSSEVADRLGLGPQVPAAAAVAVALRRLAAEVLRDQGRVQPLVLEEMFW